MLNSMPAAASLVVCSTCRASKNRREDADGRTGGENLISALTTALAGHACRERLAIQPMPCLFACSSHCTVFIRSDRRMGYLLGRFGSTPADATALLDYVAAYLETDDGMVPYARWPAGVKGHFLARVPPEGSVWKEAP